MEIRTVFLIIVSRWLISNQDAALIAITNTLVHVGNGVPCMARVVERPCIHGVRYLVQSNHPKLILKNPTQLVISAMIWFEKVRGGSMRLN